MSIEIAKNKALAVTRDLGRAALHAISPEDFEYYACTLELVDSDFKVLDVLHFPVMPTSMSINHRPLVSVKKTGRSYLSQFNDSFVGDTISINGTFGRKFRLLISTSKGRNISERKGGQFDLKVKTGYGALKLMENIIKSAYEVKNGRPRFLIFNNLAWNQSLIVEVLNFNPTQSMENNMIWNYSLEFKAIADVNKLDLASTSSGRLIDLLAVDVLNKASNDLFSDFKSIISEQVGII